MIHHTLQRISDINGKQKTKLIMDTPKSDASEREIPIMNTRETVSHHFPESAGVRADTFIHTAALLQSALTFGRIQTITASAYKALIWESGITSSLALNQSNEV